MMLDISYARRLLASNAPDQNAEESDAAAGVDPIELSESSSGVLADETTDSSVDVMSVSSDSDEDEDGEEDAVTGSSSDVEVVAGQFCNRRRCMD